MQQNLVFTRKSIDNLVLTRYNNICKKNVAKSIKKTKPLMVAFQKRCIVYVAILLYICFVILSRFSYKRLYFFQKLKGCEKMINHLKFKAEVKKQMTLKGWKYSDLAKATGYSIGTIESLMCGARASDRVYRAVANAIGISIDSAERS